MWQQKHRCVLTALHMMPQLIGLDVFQLATMMPCMAGSSTLRICSHRECYLSGVISAVQSQRCSLSGTDLRAVLRLEKMLVLHQQSQRGVEARQVHRIL